MSHTLTGVESQSGKYLDGIPTGLATYRLPFPFGEQGTKVIHKAMKLKTHRWRAMS
jgi:hypothetical protein